MTTAHGVAMTHTTQTLTYGDTFTLNATGDAEWEVDDRRHPFPHYGEGELSTRRAVIRYQGDVVGFPDGGNRVKLFDYSNTFANLDAVQACIDSLSFDFPARTAEEYDARLSVMLGRDARNAGNDKAGLMDDIYSASDIDRSTVTARAVAMFAQGITGLTGDAADQLAETIEKATLAALRA